MKKIERQSRIRCTVGAVKNNEEEENDDDENDESDNKDADDIEKEEQGSKESKTVKSEGKDEAKIGIESKNKAWKSRRR